MGKEQPITASGNIIIAPNATSAPQTVYQGGVQPAASETPAGSDNKSAVIHHYITHDAVGVPRLISQTRRHLVFHAAYYPKYGFDQQGKNVWDAMKQNPGLHLTAIFTDPDKVEWGDEFARILRPYFNVSEFKTELNASKRHFQRCLEQFGPQRVRLIDTTRLPLFPVIMIDDTLVIGHYAHSEEIAPEGLWFTIHHPRVSAMYESLKAGFRPSCTSPEEKAILRYVEELVFHEPMSIGPRTYVHRLTNLCSSAHEPMFIKKALSTDYAFLLGQTQKNVTFLADIRLNA